MSSKTFKRRNSRVKSKKTLKRNYKRNSRSKKMRGGVNYDHMSNSYIVTTNKDLNFTNARILVHYENGYGGFEVNYYNILDFTILENIKLNITKNYSLREFEVNLNINEFISPKLEKIVKTFGDALVRIILKLSLEDLNNILENSKEGVVKAKEGVVKSNARVVHSNARVVNSKGMSSEYNVNVITNKELMFIKANIIFYFRKIENDYNDDKFEINKEVIKNFTIPSGMSLNIQLNKNTELYEIQFLEYNWETIFGRTITKYQNKKFKLHKIKFFFSKKELDTILQNSNSAVLKSSSDV